MLALCSDRKSERRKRALLKKITIPRTRGDHRGIGQDTSWIGSQCDKLMDEDHKVCTIIEMCPRSLREHLELKVKEDTGREEVREAH